MQLVKPLFFAAGIIAGSVGAGNAFEVKVGKQAFNLQDYQVQRRTEAGWEAVATFPILNERQLFEMRPHLEARYKTATKKMQTLNAVQSKIGVAIVNGTRIWVGFQFYEGEFFDGVGGVGFFDASDGSIGVWRHPALKECSITSLAITNNTLYAVTRSSRELEETVCNGLVGIDLATYQSTLHLPRGGKKIREYKSDWSDDLAGEYDKTIEQLLKSLGTFVKKPGPALSEAEQNSLSRSGLIEFMKGIAESEFRGMVRGWHHN